MVFPGISPNFISSCTTSLFGQHAYWSCFLWFLCRESIFYVELRHGLPRIFGHVYDVYRLAAVSKFISIYREQRQDNTPNMICMSSKFSDHISTKKWVYFFSAVLAVFLSFVVPKLGLTTSTRCPIYFWLHLEFLLLLHLLCL